MNVRQNLYRALLLFACLSLVLAACGPAPTPETVIIKETVQVVETVKETVQVPVKEIVEVQVTPIPQEQGGPLQSVGEGEGAVSIIAWAGYIERGETDPAYDWVTQFEKDTQCLVSVKVAATSDEMVALMNEGGFDLVTASGDASKRLISSGKVQEINTSLIPSWSKVDPRLQDAPWNTVDGKHYGTPYQWGPNVLMYNTEVFPTPAIAGM